MSGRFIFVIHPGWRKTNSGGGPERILSLQWIRVANQARDTERRFLNNRPRVVCTP